MNEHDNEWQQGNLDYLGAAEDWHETYHQAQALVVQAARQWHMISVTPWLADQEPNARTAVHAAAEMLEAVARDAIDGMSR